MPGEKLEEAIILGLVTLEIIRLTKAASTSDFARVVAAVIDCENNGLGRDRNGELFGVTLRHAVLTCLWNTLPSQ